MGSVESGERGEDEDEDEGRTSGEDGEGFVIIGGVVSMKGITWEVESFQGNCE